VVFILVLFLCCVLGAGGALKLVGSFSHLVGAVVGNYVDPDGAGFEEAVEDFLGPTEEMGIR